MLQYTFNYDFGNFYSLKHRLILKEIPQFDRLIHRMRPQKLWIGTEKRQMSFIQLALLQSIGTSLRFRVNVKTQVLKDGKVNRGLKSSSVKLLKKVKKQKVRKIYNYYLTSFYTKSEIYLADLAPISEAFWIVRFKDEHVNKDLNTLFKKKYLSIKFVVPFSFFIGSGVELSRNKLNDIFFNEDEEDLFSMLEIEIEVMAAISHRFLLTPNRALLSVCPFLKK